MTDIVNLTSHVVNVVVSNNELIDIQPSGVELRVEYAPIHTRTVIYRGHPVQIVTDGVVIAVRNLPPRKENTLYIASYAGAHYCNTSLGRDDVICPGTARKDHPLKLGDEVVAVRKFRGSHLHT